MTAYSVEGNGTRIPIREGAFIESTDGIALVANKCKTCGQLFFPKTALCFTCLGENLEDVILSRRGKLYSYTVSYMPSAHFAPPYAVGYVDMPEGVRIFAPLRIVQGMPFKVGMDVEVFGDQLWAEGDRVIYGYKFLPV